MGEIAQVIGRRDCGKAWKKRSLQSVASMRRQGIEPGILRSNALIDRLDDAKALEAIIDHLLVVFWSAAEQVLCLLTSDPQLCGVPQEAVVSKESRVSQFWQLYDSFLNQNPRELLTAPQVYSDFDGLNLDEARSTLTFVLEVFDSLRAGSAASELSWQFYNQLQSQLQAVHNLYSQFKSARDQQSFQNFVQNLDNLAYNLRMLGAASLAFGGAQVEAASRQLATDMERLGELTGEVERLRDEVKTLIAPAVAGSLSQAFTARKKALLWGRIIWGVAVLVVAVTSIIATSRFAADVSKAIEDAARLQTQTPIWLSVLVRSVFLLPLYAAFGFAFSQYRKERDFEEEYAHKAAVATSLPQYGDLTREPAVRDQIVTGATTVIFTSPSARLATDHRVDKSVAGSVKEILDAVGALIPKR